MYDSSPGLDSLLSRLHGRAMTRSEPARGQAGPLASADEAMAMYRLTTRLVELQLELADQGECDPQELRIAREVLVGTRELLHAALREAEPGEDEAPPPALQVVAAAPQTAAPRRLHSAR